MVIFLRILFCSWVCPLLLKGSKYFGGFHISHWTNGNVTPFLGIFSIVGHIDSPYCQIFPLLRNLWLRHQPVQMYWVEPHPCCHDDVFSLVLYNQLRWYLLLVGGRWMVFYFFRTVWLMCISQMPLLCNHISSWEIIYYCFLYLTFSLEDHVLCFRT